MLWDVAGPSQIISCYLQQVLIDALNLAIISSKTTKKAHIRIVYNSEEV